MSSIYPQQRPFGSPIGAQTQPIGAQPAQSRPISYPPRPTTAPLQPWDQYVAQQNASTQAPAQSRPSTGNALADHYQALADRPISNEDRYGGRDAGPALKNFYREQESFYGGPPQVNAPPKTVYHANGTISNPPTEDPGFRVYNNLSQMPAADQHQIQAMRSGYRTVNGQPIMDPSAAPGQNPQMAPDPSKQMPQIGVPSRSQAGNTDPSHPSYNSMTPYAPAPSLFDSHESMRQAMTSGLTRDMQKAQAAGDTKTLYDLFAQRAALDKGGFEGHAHYMNEKALLAAQIAKAGGVAGGLVGADGMLDPARMFDRGLDQTNSVEGGMKAQQSARILNAINGEAKGQHPTVRPEDSATMIKDAYPQLSPFFAVDKNGAPTQELGDALRGLQQQKPGIFKDPSSVVGQASREGIKQLYSGDLANSLDIPVNPKEWEPNGFKKTGQPHFDAAVNLLPQLVGNTAAGLGNLFTGRFGSVWNPEGSHNDAVKTNELYRQLMGK